MMTVKGIDSGLTGELYYILFACSHPVQEGSESG